MAGLATVAIAEAVKPRGGTALLLDWDEVRRTSSQSSRSDVPPRGLTTSAIATVAKPATKPNSAERGLTLSGYESRDSLALMRLSRHTASFYSA